MGASQGRMKKEELDELQKTSKFDEKELKAMHKQFKKDSPQGVVTKHEFTDVMNQMGIQDKFLQELIFSTFEAEGDGVITFQDLVSALSIIARGSADQKLLFAFRMYDLNGDGFITKDEMQKVMNSFYKLVGPLVSFSGKKYESPQHLVDEVFEMLDTNSDGKISLEEYKQGAMKNPDIIEGLKLLRRPLSASPERTTDRKATFFREAQRSATN